MSKQKAKPCFEYWQYQAYEKTHGFVFDSCIYSTPSFVKQCISSRPKKRNSSRKKKGDFMYIAFRFEGFPTAEQIAFLNQNIGCARLIWNLMKADFDKKNKIYTAAHYKDEEHPWLADADSYALSNVQLNFESALSDYRNGEKGKPRFKKKHLAKASYKTNNVRNCLRLEKDGLVLPKLKSKIKVVCHREIPEGGTLKNCTVTHEPNGKWYFSLLFEYPNEEERFSDNINEFMETSDISCLNHIGLDMSLPNLFVDSDGCTPSYFNKRIITFEKHYRKLESRIAQEQRRLSRMQKDSNNYRKQCIRIAKLHAKAKHQRNDFLHQISVRLARSYDIISIEDLDMSAIKQSLKFGKSVSDNGWGMFVSMLGYKCHKYGTFVIRIDKWFPSSKLCSHCGHVHKELKLSDRTYVCPNCGFTMERDYHAAKNIDSEGLRLFVNALSYDSKAKKPRKSEPVGTPGIVCRATACAYSSAHNMLAG